MPGIAITYGARLLRTLFLALATALTLLPQAYGDTDEERRVNVGIRLFPAILAAHHQSENQSQTDTLEVLVVYLDDLAYAKQVAQRITQTGPLKGHTLKTAVVNLSDLALTPRSPPYAIFIAQDLGDEIEAVVSFSLRTTTLSFSPFRGDVEAGILAGLSISDRILPYINSDTLAELGLEFKPFFMKVAEKYAK